MLSYWLRKTNYGGAGSYAQRLRIISHDLKSMCRARQLKVTFKVFTPTNTGVDKASEFPELGSAFKAAFMKTALQFFTEKSIELAEKSPEDELLCLMAVCVWNLHAAVCTMDHGDLILGDREAKDISDCIRNHLIAWQHLAYRFELLKMKLFKLRPKHHSLDHLGSQVARTRINPRRVMSCWNDESFLGYLKKIGIKCHVKTILERLYQRYILGLALRWQETIKGVGV